MFNPFLHSVLLIFFYMLCWFVLALIKKDNSIADVAWGPGFVFLFWWQYFFYGRSLFTGIMVTLWGARLAVYLFLRNRQKGEDWRYRQWREEWGKFWVLRSFLQVFMLQGLFMWIIALPLMQGPTTSDHPWLGWIRWSGAALWLAGFLWETVADWQLWRFKNEPVNQGKLLKEGLWKFSRHPNYFGEIVLWWGIFLFCFPASGAWYILLSPLAITWLLAKVSGVPMLEKKYREHPEYKEYTQQKNALIPDMKIFWKQADGAKLHP